MKRLTTQILTAIGFVTFMTVVGLWSSPKLMAAIKAALVQNVDEPGRNPYSENKSTVDCIGFGTNNCNLQFSPVPAGKRLVVTNVSGLIVVAGGSSYRTVTLYSTIARFTQNLPVIFQGSLQQQEYYVFNQAVVHYVEPGDRPSVDIDSDHILITSNLFMTGYYISLP
jgi:hypothetical protein